MIDPEIVDPMSDRKRPFVDPWKLASDGYVRAANRCFFHPLGLHMVVQIFAKDLEHPFRIRVLDCRDGTESRLLN